MGKSHIFFYGEIHSPIWKATAISIIESTEIIKTIENF
jgi:hypothetical protein